MTLSRAAVLCLSLCLLAVGATRAVAQPVDDVRAGASRPCWDCDREKQALPAFLEWQIGMWSAWSFNKFIRPGNIGDVGPSFWAKNWRGRWDWDPNSFEINQIGHPLQGSTYFNGYRTNGYGFWTSSAMTLVGSFVWECCGERNLPSINDLLTTWLGGTTIGEVSRRLSDLALDNTQSGGERRGREFLGFVANPVRGIDRFVRGHTRTIGENPPGHRPEWLRGVIGVGGVALGSVRGENKATLGGAKLATRLIYGLPDAVIGRPFSYFDIDLELTTVPNAPIYYARSRGSLFGKVLDTTAVDRKVLAGFMRYEYVRSRAFELGEQSVSVGLLRETRRREGRRLFVDVGLRAVPISAIEDDFQTPSDEGRNYDYSFGGGLLFESGLLVADRGILRVSYSNTAYRVADGVARSHMLERSELYLQRQLSENRGVSLGLRYQSRRTYFSDRPHTWAQSPEVWASYLFALPSWR